MNNNELKDLEREFIALTKKYNLYDNVLISNKVIIKPSNYDENQTLACLFAAVENIISNITCNIAKDFLHNDYDEAVNIMIKELTIVVSILKKKIKQRVEEVKKEKLIYN